MPDHRKLGEYKPEFALHFLCPFRIELKGKIQLGYNDLFISSDPNDFYVDLNIQNSTLFDRLADELLSDLTKLTVEKVALTKYGDILITLTSGSISSFICASEGEAWRFFKTQTNEQHLVASCGNITFQ